MIKGSTIIFNKDYIAELESLKEDINNKIQHDQQNQKQLLEEYNRISEKLEWALDYTDIIEQVIKLEFPTIFIVCTVKGLYIPLNNIQIL